MPDERLKIEQLVKFYNVGHSPVREAILVQSTAGLITHSHHKGHRVAPTSIEDYDDIVETYLQIYHLALDMALEKGGDSWEEKIIVQLHRTKKVQKVLPDGDPEGRENWQRAYFKFHYTVLEGCKSPRLLSIFTNIAAQLQRYSNLYADMESDRKRDNNAEHEELVDALVKRDKDQVAKLIDAYYRRSEPIKDSIMAGLQQEKS